VRRDGLSVECHKKVKEIPLRVSMFVACSKLK
jgi:hypothetical protein